jgi:hypothetical protein
MENIRHPYTRNENNENHNILVCHGEEPYSPHPQTDGLFFKIPFSQYYVQNVFRVKFIWPLMALMDKRLRSHTHTHIYNIYVYGRKLVDVFEQCITHTRTHAH